VSTGGAKSLSEKSSHAIGDDALALQSQVLMTSPGARSCRHAGSLVRQPTERRREEELHLQARRIAGDSRRHA